MSNLRDVTNRTLLSVSEVAARHNLAKRTVQYAIARGHLKAQKLPGTTGAYIIDAADLTRWLSSRGAA